MPQQTKTGNIGHGFHAVNIGECRTSNVHPAHHFCRQSFMFFLQQGFFLCGCQNTNAQRLGQEQLTPCFSGAVFLHAFSRHNAGYRKAKDRLWGIDRVAARQRNTRLTAGKASAFGDFAGDFRCQFIQRPAQNSNCHNRFAAHGENIADGVSRGDATKIKRIIDNRHKEIGGADNAGAVSQIVYGRVVAGFITHQ